MIDRVRFSHRQQRREKIACVDALIWLLFAQLFANVDRCVIKIMNAIAVYVLLCYRRTNCGQKNQSGNRFRFPRVLNANANNVPPYHRNKSTNSSCEKLRGVFVTDLNITFCSGKPVTPIRESIDNVSRCK